MNSRYTNLYQLIGAMKPEECAAFEKKYTAKNHKYLELYEALKAQIADQVEPNESNERKLETTLDTKDLHTLLRDTHEKILEFLDEHIAAQASPLRELSRLLNRAEYCQQRGLGSAAQDAWQQAYQIAVEHQLYDQYPCLYRLRIAYGFKFDTIALREDIRGFAEAAFQLGVCLQINANSPQVFGNVEEVVQALRNDYQKEYKALMQHLQKTQHHALQEEVITALGVILQANIKDTLAGQGSCKLAAQGSNEFYEDWFYRLLFLQNCLAKQDEEYFYRVYLRKKEHFEDTPQHFLPPDSLPEGADEQAARWHALGDAWVKAWRLFENLELIYTSFNSGYYDRVQVGINEIRQHTLTHDAPIKYSALGYFLARKLMHLEILLGLREKNYQEKVENIVKTIPEHLRIFSQAQETDLVLRYEMNVVLLRFCACYGNGQKQDRKQLREDLKKLLDSKILKQAPHYEADIRLMCACLGLYEKDADLDNNLRNLKRFLEKHTLYEGFGAEYHKMLRKAHTRDPNKQSIMSVYEKHKQNLLAAQDKDNPFHHALCEIFELSK